MDGRVFDARVEAGRITAQAEEQAAEMLATARREAEELVDAARQRCSAITREARCRGFERGRLAAALATGHEIGSGDRDVAPDADAEHPGVGRVRAVVGLVIRAEVPGARLRDVVVIGRGERRAGRAFERVERILAEVIGFSDDEVLLMPLGDLRGVGPRSPVMTRGRPLTISVGAGLLGQVLDGLGRPMDGPGDRARRSDSGLAGPEWPIEWPVDRAPPDLLTREPICRPMVTGLRAIDGLLTLGEGQRIGLFAPPGAGKSSLLAQIARAVDVDVVVIGLVGERGREARELIERQLGPARQRTVVVCATSDAPSLVRERSAHVATAIAEWYRDDRGARVLLLIDSLTRYARARREIALSVGEAPAQRGYPPGVFAAIPALIERAGNSARGTMTAIYTVLEPGVEGDDPMVDEARAALDGHIVLSPERAARGQWPAIDVLRSLSRAMPGIVERDHLVAAARARRLLAIHQAHRELIALGAYRAGSDVELDRAVACMPALEAYLTQPGGHPTSWRDSVVRLCALTGDRDRLSHTR